ncbi:hypothetical protein PHIN3_299 [Sinorhizobium phage phiN3]|uniref:Uncharacterized protein n=1 Tax=Sinorhizobium phage phiN3 TaxID=1647405 RepID=A0A0F6YPH8_9CAUD|nr:hypothetical protein AVT40_gp234 [Sinorhizobium phage phiN3]AKF13562.1 hypothetical protein PHIN3_299 [Sinorhizobium phage phiN3]
MTQTRSYNDVTFKSRPNTGDPSRIIWDGGVKGGMIFVSTDGKYGNSSEWFDTFEEAADVTIRRCHAVYLKAKKLVEEYEGKKKRKKT